LELQIFTDVSNRYQPIIVKPKVHRLFETNWLRYFRQFRTYEACEDCYTQAGMSSLILIVLFSITSFSFAKKEALNLLTMNLTSSSVFSVIFIVATIVLSLLNQLEFQ